MASIVGIGRTVYSSHSGRTTLAMAVEACRAALDDAGLDVSAVDGIATFSVGGDSARSEEVAYGLGLDGTGYNLDIAGGGNIAVKVVTEAMLAVESGLCDTILVYRSLNGRSGRRYGRIDGAVEIAGAQQFGAPHGYIVPAQWVAMWYRKYVERYGGEPEDLGHVAVTFREHAIANPHAVSREPLSMDDYLRGRWVAEPLRVYDCARESDAAVAVLITTGERARDLRHRGVTALATAEHHGRGGDTGVWPDMTRMYSAFVAPRLWERSGLAPRDIDVACLYDCFTYTALATTEDYGFCDKGEGAAFYAQGRATYGGDLVINPHGGLLSEGYVHGMNHHFEAVLQLRGEAGERQVTNARLALVTAGVCNWGGAVIYAAA